MCTLHSIFQGGLGALLALGLAACAQPSSAPTSRDSARPHAGEPIGAVYAASNGAESNSVLAFAQYADGSLEPMGEYGTGGRGTGQLEVPGLEFDASHPLMDGVDPLISAYGLLEDPSGRWLYVVNAGDGSVSSFVVQADRSLQLASHVAAGDRFPISIAAHGDRVIVASIGTEANAGAGSGNITAYRVDVNGRLIPIAGSTRELGARPSCVAFTSDGRFVVVSELATGRIKSFAVTESGVPSAGPISSVTSPMGESERWLPIPVGFSIAPLPGGDRDVVIVSEARFLDKQGRLRADPGKVPQSPLYSWQTGSTSSYTIDRDGQVKLVSADVLTGNALEGGQIANCWVVISPDGGRVWTANALSSSLSEYTIGPDGSIRLAKEAAYKDDSELLFFSDVDQSGDGRFLTQLIGNAGAVLVLRIEQNGTLTRVGLYRGLPAVGSYGIVAL